MVAIPPISPPTDRPRPIQRRVSPLRAVIIDKILTATRDDFNKADILHLAHRVIHLCSNPDCRAPTRGPHTESNQSMNIGKAAHINAASEGGPRFDRDQGPEDRASTENGIWLCAICADKVDKDCRRYPASLLHRWKGKAEAEADSSLGRPGSPSAMQPMIEVEVLQRLARTEDQGMIHHPTLFARFTNAGTIRVEDWYFESNYQRRF